MSKADDVGLVCEPTPTSPGSVHASLVLFDFFSCIFTVLVLLWSTPSPAFLPLSYDHFIDLFRCWVCDLSFFLPPSVIDPPRGPCFDSRNLSMSSGPRLSGA